MAQSQRRPRPVYGRGDGAAAPDQWACSGVRRGHGRGLAPTPATSGAAPRTGQDIGSLYIDSVTLAGIRV